MYVRDRLFIGGEWVAPASDQVINVVNPVSEQVIGQAPSGTAADIDRAVDAARNCFEAGTWVRTPPTERALVLERAAELLHKHRAEIRNLIIDENGSPYEFVENIQIQTSIDLLRFYAALTRQYPFESEYSDDAGRSLVVREPAGVVATIVPFNSPLRSTLLKAVPALAAGCSVVHKPDVATPLDTFMLAEILTEAGLPAGAFNVIPGGREVGQHLVARADVDKVAFTGSTAAGRQIMSSCSNRLARVSLELGGKSAAIVLDDAPLDTTIANLLPLSFMNSGQACVAQTRILVSQRRYDAFVDALSTAVDAMTVGDPTDPATVIGPMVTSSHRERVESYLAVGTAEGAAMVRGGGRPHARGWFVEPTIFAGVHNKMRIAREEVFGPVVCILPYDQVADAVAIANDSDYGLAGSVWTDDDQLGLDVARRVRSGTYSVNGARQADFTPFGGFKQSGIGREATAGTLDMYTETKSIAIASDL